MMSVRVASIPMAMTISEGSIVTTSPHPKRDVPVQEALHDDLPAHRADRRRREAGEDERDGEDDARTLTENRLQRLVRVHDRVDMRESVRVEGGGGHQEHRHIDETGDAHRDADIDHLEAEEAARLVWRSSA